MTASLARVIRFIETAGPPNSRLYLWATPLALFASISVHITQPEPEVFARYLLANLASLAICAGVYSLSLRVAGPEARAKFGFLVGLGLALGVTKQLTTAAFVVALGVEAELGAAILARLATPLLGIWFTLSMAALQAGRKQLETLRQQLVGERTRQLVQQAAAGGERREHLDQLVAEIRQQLGRAVGGDADGDVNGDGGSAVGSELSPQQLAQLLRQIVDTKVRPLSHQIWERENRKLASYRGGELAARAIMQLPYPVLWVTGIFTLTSAPTILTLAQPGLGWQWVVSYGLGVAIVLWAANGLKRLLAARLKLASRQLAWLVLAATSAAAAWLASRTPLELFGTLGRDAGWLLVLTVSAWWLGTVLVSAGVVSAARKTYAEQLEALNDLLGPELDRQAAQARAQLLDREIANHLHSSVQNQMLAQALRIENETDVDFARELNQIIALLQPRGEAQSVSIADQLAQLAADWHGIINIEFAIDPNAQLDAAAQQLVGLIAIEAVNNAYRHGGANQIVISLDASGLTVRDNGSLATAGRAGDPGLGSRLFDSAGEWSLEAVESGSELRVNVNQRHG